MSHTVAFIYMVVFATVLLGLLVTFGISTPGFNNTIKVQVDCVFNNIPANTCSFPPFNPPKFANATSTTSSAPAFPQCLALVPVIGITACLGSVTTTITNIGIATWNGFLFLGYALSLVPIYTYVFFNKIYVSLSLLNTVVNVINNDYGVPFFGFLVYGFLIILGFMGLAVFKPGGHGS